MSPSDKPFDEVKYKALTDGLEISEIKYNSIVNESNTTQRFDSEYFIKNYIKNINALASREHDTLYPRFAHVKGGKRLPLTASFAKSGIRYARAEDMKGKFLNVSNSPFISEDLHDLLKLYTTVYNDVILTIVGSIGDVAVNKLHETINLTENCVRLHCCSPNMSAYLFCFLLSTYGQLQIKRETVGTVQPKLAIERIKLFKVPIFNTDFYNSIDSIVEKSWQKMQSAQLEYADAERLLHNAINFDIEPVSVDVKSLSESFMRSGRLDAEYYQPKYDTLFETLSKFSTTHLGGRDGIVKIKKSIEPGSEAYQTEGVPFVRVSDVNKFEIIEPSIKLSHEIVPEIEKLYPRKGTILLSKDGSVGIAYKVMEDMQVVTSGALLHLTLKDNNKVLPDYLTLVLNSQIVQLQAERDCNGAVIQHWKPSDIEKVIIPLLDMDKQKVISDKVQESFRLRKESKQLLDDAVKAVEMAIETDEHTALLWLAMH